MRRKLRCRRRRLRGRAPPRSRRGHHHVAWPRPLRRRRVLDELRSERERQRKRQRHCHRRRLRLRRCGPADGQREQHAAASSECWWAVHGRLRLQRALETGRVTVTRRCCSRLRRHRRCRCRFHRRRRAWVHSSPCSSVPTHQRWVGQLMECAREWNRAQVDAARAPFGFATCAGHRGVQALRLPLRCAAPSIARVARPARSSGSNADAPTTASRTKGPNSHRRGAFRLVAAGSRRGRRCGMRRRSALRSRA